MTEGVFVAFEGLDGAGTTTQARRAAEFVAADTERDPAHSVEPTEGPIGTQIRRGLEGDVDFGPDTLALLFAADRLEHLRNEIDPHLDDGDVVILDRYAMSSYAYQRAEGVDGEWLRTINRHARVPDCTIFLDVPPATCIERLENDGRGTDRYEREETLAAVEAAYREAIEAERAAGNDVVEIDGTQSEEEVAAVVRETIQEYL